MRKEDFIIIAMAMKQELQKKNCNQAFVDNIAESFENIYSNFNAEKFKQLFLC